MQTQTDYYAELNVSPRASADEIKRAYRQLALQNHPDRGGNPQRMQKLNEAWTTLSNPATRAAYDTERALEPELKSPDVPSPPPRKTKSKSKSKSKTSRQLTQTQTESPLIHLLGRIAGFFAYMLGRLLRFFVGKK